MRRSAICFVSILLLTSACGSKAKSSSPTVPSANEYKPSITPADFTPDVTNQWFPLPAGLVLTYTGTKDGKHARDIVTVMNQTKIIQGVKTRIVVDQLFLDNKLEERTNDYYAQKKDGSVWYFGEDTAELNASGSVTSTEGSWLYGTDGAQPGIIMPANPKVGDKFRQEYLKGQAEDEAEIVDMHATAKVPYGTFPNSIKTKETTRLEPKVVDNKYYAASGGIVEEVSVKGPKETLLLQSAKLART